MEDFPRYFGGGTGDTLILDDWNQIDPTETILLPKSVIEIQKIIRKNPHTILQITSKEYPYDSDPHYVDARFVQIYETVDIVPSRSIKLPSRSQVLGKLESQVGKPYIW